jgi:hypothetical protein
VGFPIRKSTDQRVFAPPRSLSQRITSFIACACQGIHQLPLRHLIVLIANAHPEQAPNGIGTKRPASRDLSGGAVRQTNHLRGIERPLRQTAAVSTCSLCEVLRLAWGIMLGPWSPNKSSLYDVKQNRRKAKSLPQTLFLRMNPTTRSPVWWSRTGSNRRPPACKAGALPAELRPLIPGRNGGPGRT